MQPRKKISLDQRAACQHDVVIPTLDLANGTGENYKFEALSVPIVPSNLMRLEWSHVNLEIGHTWEGAEFPRCEATALLMLRDGASRRRQRLDYPFATPTGRLARPR